MQYDNVVPAIFLDRPNRFIAHAMLEGRTVVCHVKNTGRCRELLIPGAEIYLQHMPAPTRKTQWDLIAVQKGDRLVNMDAAAPNAVFGEWLRAGGLGFWPETVKPEATHGDSRFDFFFTGPQGPAFAEVKGVTLEQDGVARFPDAPTLRGVKHLRGLARAVAEGYDAWAVFIIQMRGVERFEPAWDLHPEFGQALAEAAAAGVHVLALDCAVTPDSLTARQPVPVRLEH